MCWLYLNGSISAFRVKTSRVLPIILLFILFDYFSLFRDCLSSWLALICWSNTVGLRFSVCCLDFISGDKNSVSTGRLISHFSRQIARSYH